MKKQKVDFVIRYEHKVRELESIMLLKLELEKRGYTVAFVGNYDYKQLNNYQPSVLITPAIYSNKNLNRDWLKYGLIKKIANLQWEQIFTINNENDINFAQNIKGVGTRVVNFCWGDRRRKQIIKCGVNNNCAITVGQINADLLKINFRSTLKTKEELSKVYNINFNKKWHLFISSFAYCELDEFQKELIIKAIGSYDYNRFKEISDKSRDSILDWFEIMLYEDKQTILIYRPHPDEARKSERLRIMESKYANFRVISDLAIKHWINASDKIYNWYSTGIIDAIILEKPWRLLRPFKIDEDLDYRMMNKAKNISTLKDYMLDFNNYNKKEIIDNDILKSYYHISNDYTYLKVCDILEDMLNSSEFDIQYTIKEYIYLNLSLIKQKAGQIIVNLSETLLPNFLFKILFKKRLEVQSIKREILINGYEKNVINEVDIKDITQRLKPIVYGK